MPVLIEGMEMPKGCAFCQIGKRNGKKMVCPLCDEEWDIRDPMSADHRLDNCPLVPVPPHGRLIDADGLAAHKFVGAEHDISIADGGACYRRGWNDAIEAIMENAETIIGEE